MDTVRKGLIVFEGLDGAGTTTQLHLLGAKLRDRGLPVRETAEPSDSFIGRQVRSVLRREESTTPLALCMLYTADRENHLNNPGNGIIKDLDKGMYVLSDRYFFSTFAYQGVDVDISVIASLNSSFPYPEYLFYIDTPVSECISRIEKRGQEKELFEKAEFLQKVRNNYEKSFSVLPVGVHFARIDGRKRAEEISNSILSVLDL